MGTREKEAVTAIVVWDADFASRQLERMMRFPLMVNIRPWLKHPLWMDQKDYDDIVKWSKENP